MTETTTKTPRSFRRQVYDLRQSIHRHLTRTHISHSGTPHHPRPAPSAARLEPALARLEECEERAVHLGLDHLSDAKEARLEAQSGELWAAEELFDHEAAQLEDLPPAILAKEIYMESDFATATTPNLCAVLCRDAALDSQPDSEAVDAARRKNLHTGIQMAEEILERHPPAPV